MKKNILFLCFVVSVWSLAAQITVTNSTFPEAGDTLRTVVDDSPNINLQSPGEDLTWNFTSLDGPVFESIISDANQGAAFDFFSNATILMGQPPVAESYYQTTASVYTSLGYSGQDPIGLGLDVIFKNSPPVVERKSPLNYNDSDTNESSVLVAYAWDDLPTEITGGLGLPITPDSIAVNVETVRSDEVDAWGKVALPVGTFDVLRVKRLDLTDSKVEAKFPFVGWVDITEQLIPTNPILGLDTSLIYIYYNDESKEPVAVVSVDPISEEPQNVRYKSVDATTNVIKLYEKKPNVYAYPNPAIEDIRFDFINVPKGQYDLKIYNILGVEIWKQQHQVQSTNDTIQLDVSNFRKGTYLYSLIDENGKNLVTRRLIILRP